MNRLSALTQPELVHVDTALAVINGALELLLDRGICAEDDGIDPEALQEAVAQELERRADDDGAYRVGEALACGQIVEVIRPDGERGYMPIDRGG